MASTSSTIRVIFDGAVEGLRRAARSAEAEIERFNSALDRNQRGIAAFERGGARLGSVVSGMVSGFVKLGSASASVQGLVAVVGTLASVTTQLAPAALALPGIFLGVGVAVGTAKLALAGFSDAVKGDAEALAKFGVEGQAAVKAVQSLGAGFDKMRKAVSEEFFRGLAPQIKAAGDALLELGTQHLPKVAAGFNGIAKAALGVMQTDTFKGALAKIIDNTALALRNAEGSLAAFLHGFVRLGEVGSKFLPALGTAIDRVALKFNAWVNEGVESGRIEEMIDRAIDGFKTLGRILDDIGDSFRVAFSAFNEGLTGGGGTLESIEQVTSAFEELASSGSAQAALKALGETVRVVGDTFREVLVVAIRELGPVIVEIAPFVQELARQLGDVLITAIRILGPLLRDLARFLSENKEIVVPLALALIPLAAGFKAVGLAVSAIRGARAFADGLRLIRDVIGGINPATLRAIASAFRRFAIPALVVFFTPEFIRSIDDFMQSIKTAEPSKLNEVADSFHTFRGRMETFLAGNWRQGFHDWSLEFKEDLRKLFAKDEGERSTIGNLIDLPGIVEDILEFKLQVDGWIEYIRTIPERLKAQGSDLDEWFRITFIDPIVQGFEQLKTDINTKIEEVKAVVNGWLADPFGAGFELGQWIRQHLIDPAIEGFEQFKLTTEQKLEEAKQKIVEFVTVKVPEALNSLPGILAEKARAAWDSFFGETKAGGDRSAAESGTVPGKTGGSLGPLTPIVRGIAKSAWDFFFGETQAGGNRSVGEAGKVPGQTGTATNPIIGILREKATAAWNGFVEGCRSGINTALAVIRALPGLITGAIGNTATLLYSKGVALIDGLTAGIKAAYQSALSFVRGIAAGLAAAKGPLSYDKVVMIPAGLALMRGLQDGIATGYDKVRSYVSGLASDLASALGPTDVASQLGGLEAASIARAQQAAAQRARMGDLVTQVTATNSREAVVPVVNVLLSQERFAELARVEIDTASRETARRVTAGLGQTF